MTHPDPAPAPAPAPEFRVADRGAESRVPDPGTEPAVAPPVDSIFAAPKGPQAKEVGPGCAAYLPSLLALVSIFPVYVILALVGWGVSDGCDSDATNCYPPGWVVLSPIGGLVSAAIFQMVVPGAPKESRARVVLALLGEFSLLFALGTFVVAASSA